MKLWYNVGMNCLVPILAMAGMFFSATDEKSVEKEISVDPVIGEASTNGAEVAGDAYMKYDPVATNELDKIVNEAVQTAIGAAASNMVERLYSAPEFVAAASNAVDQVKIATETKAIEIALLEAKAKAAQDEAERVEAAIAKRRIASRVFKLAHANAEEVASRLNEMWNGDFGANWKIAKIAMAFPEANSLMVTAPQMLLDNCEKIIKEIDVEVPQVYIEARFIELSNNASHKLGIDWAMLDGMKGSLSLDVGWKKQNFEGVSEYTPASGTTPEKYTFSNDAGVNSANLSHVNGTIGMSELALILRALESSEDARTFSNPKIIVSSGKKAVVDMTTKYPNVQIAAKKTINNNNESVDLDMKMASIPGEDKFMFAKEAYFSWGISLEVTPRISTNGLINVSIVPTISDCIDYVTAGTNSGDSKSGDSYSAKYPVINVQRLVTEFNMASETTAVIGGLSRTIESQKDNGIPWLRDIWWIGPKLFGSKVRVKEQKEIIVFVTVGFVNPASIMRDAGLPKNAVLGRQYTEGIRKEPGDRRRQVTEGVQSLDLRPLEEQYSDPRRTNRFNRVQNTIPLPFTKDPDYRREK